MQGHFLVSENDKEKFDILCEINETLNDDIPNDQNELYVEVESTCNVIKSLAITDEGVKRKYFDKLLSLAQTGLEAENARTQTAMLALEKLKDEIIIVEGQRIKNSYMKKLGIAAGIIGAILSVIIAVNYYFLGIELVQMFAVTWISSLVGTWVSYGARKFNISFEDLNIIEKDMMTPYIRLIYIGLCAIIFELFLISGIFEIQLGSINTSNIDSDVLIQIIIGVICGLVESKMGISIYKKAISIIGDN
jgi:hypothetical protein